jgi:putative transposase
MLIHMCFPENSSEDVLEHLFELFLIRGVPEFIRSDNNSEFTADSIRSRLEDLGVAALYIEPGSPWENGYVESFIGKLRNELLNGEVLDTSMEAKVLVEGWRKEYNRFRPHSSSGYRQRVLHLKAFLSQAGELKQNPYNFYLAVTVFDAEPP